MKDYTAELVSQFARTSELPESLHPSFIPASGISELPADYENFIRTFGKGCFQDADEPYFRWYVLGLYEGYTDYLWSSVLKVTEEQHGFMPDEFPPPYPASPGLLPWGMDSDGIMFYWVTEGPPDEWMIAVDWRDYLTRYPVNMTTFIYNSLTRQEGYDIWAGVEVYRTLSDISYVAMECALR